MKHTPSIDIVMIAWSPNKRRMKFMQQTMESLRKNTKMAYRLTVVDNGPAGQTEYLKTCDIDQHLIQPHNQGPAESRNIGTQATSGDIIAYCDNDLQFSRKWLKCATRILRKYPSHKLIVAPSYSQPMTIRRNYVGTFRHLETYKQAAGYCLVMWRKAAIELGPWDYGTLNIEDKTFCIKAWNSGYVIVRQPPAWPQVTHIGEKCKTFDPHRCIFLNGTWQKK